MLLTCQDCYMCWDGDTADLTECPSCAGVLVEWKELWDSSFNVPWLGLNPCPFDSTTLLTNSATVDFATVDYLNNAGQL